MAKKSTGKSGGSKAAGKTVRTTATKRTVKKSTSKAAVTGKFSKQSTAAAKASSKSASVRASGPVKATKKASRHLFLVGEKERLDRLVEGFGNNRVAALLNVSQSQPSRWRKGEENLSPESRRRVLDIDYVLSRLLQIYPREQAEIWLTSFNAHLGGRPTDVLRLKGVSPVIEAIDAEAEGAFA